MIAEHAGDGGRAVACYEHAVGLNPHFAATFADDARNRLSRLRD